jgi:hypothetical protein
MSKISKRKAIVVPSVAEDRAITSAAKSDPDAQPLTPTQLNAMVPIPDLTLAIPTIESAPNLREYQSMWDWQVPYWLSLGIFGVVVFAASLALLVFAIVLVPFDLHGRYANKLVLAALGVQGMFYGVSQVRAARKERQSPPQ